MIFKVKKKPTCSSFLLLTDVVSNKEQVSLTLRYVTCGHKVKEMFLEFIEVEIITGKALAEEILQSLSAWNLSIANLADNVMMALQTWLEQGLFVKLK